MRLFLPRSNPRLRAGLRAVRTKMISTINKKEIRTKYLVWKQTTCSSDETQKRKKHGRPVAFCFALAQQEPVSV